MRTAAIHNFGIFRENGPLLLPGKNPKNISDTMHHAIPRRTASREIDAVHPLGPTRVHPIHPTRPRTGQCARHGHVDHHTRFDRRPKVSHHTQTSLQCGAPPMGLQFLRPAHPLEKKQHGAICTLETGAPTQATDISTHMSPRLEVWPRPGALPPMTHARRYQPPCMKNSDHQANTSKPHRLNQDRLRRTQPPPTPDNK